MDGFTKKNLSEIPIEEAHGGSGSRQILVDMDALASSAWEAVTKGFLKPGAAFDWHAHNDADEVFIVSQGNGTYHCDGKVTPYKEGDIFATRAGTEHKIEAEESVDSEFYFIRVST